VVGGAWYGGIWFGFWRCGSPTESHHTTTTWYLQRIGNNRQHQPGHQQKQKELESRKQIETPQNNGSHKPQATSHARKACHAPPHCAAGHWHEATDILHLTCRGAVLGAS
jgi:hypothetical protein